MNLVAVSRAKAEGTPTTAFKTNVSLLVKQAVNLCLRAETMLWANVAGMSQRKSKP